MSRKPLAIAAAVLVGAGVLFAVSTANHEGRLDDRLVLYGNVDIRQVNLAFNVEGRLDRVAVEEGDRVAAGQHLASLEKGYLEDALAIAEARVAAQAAVVDKLEAGSRPEEISRARADVSEAEAAVTNTRATFERQAKLVKTSAASRQAFDDARGALRQAEARLAAAREVLALAVAGPREEDRRTAKAQLDSAKASASLLRRRLKDADLTAPSDGVIQTRVHEPGAVLLPNTTVFTLSLTEPVWVRTYVGEPDLGRVTPGARAEVTTDGAPDTVYHGHVGFISPVAEFTPKAVETPDLRSSLVYRLRVVVDDADTGALRQGMPVTVTLPLAEKSQD